MKNKSTYPKIISGIITICLLMLFSHATVAQKSKLNVLLRMDTTKMLIGEQIKAQVLIDQAKGLEVIRPVFLDTLGAFEVISIGNIDTVFSENKDLISTEQILAITSFDSGFYVIPPIRAGYKQDSSTFYAESEALLVTVYTLPVDTSQAIKDIKANIDVPLGFMDILPYLIILVLLIFAFFVARFIYNRFFRKEETTEIKKVIRPAHLIALEEIEMLKSEQLWQKGEIKMFHTRVTDIVRDYIKNRYGINAPEMTTDELLESPSIQIFDANIKDDLTYILRLADLVKFAKGKPSATENEQSLIKCEEIVQKTKLIVVESEKVMEESAQ
ncbi:MAG: hypothetical protein HKN22_00165 [Bacteroidia bacterium]|nr:hypothetical protein [Bacteroidia bacterium]